MPRLDSVAQTVNLMRKDLLGDDFRKWHAQVAREERDRVIREAAPGKPLTKVFVDGREGASEDSVKLYGVITYTFEYLREIVQFAWNKLREFSPVDTGAYLYSHFLMVDGAEAMSVDAIQPGSVAILTNTQPYARKIEVAYKGWYLPGNVYQRAAQATRARFGNVAKIEHTFIPLLGRGGKMIAGRAGNKSDVRYPALRFSAL